MTAWFFGGFAFLLIAVPLVPFRYLALANGAPGGMERIVQYAPVGVSLLIGLLWGWQRRRRWGAALSGVWLGWPVVALLGVGLLSSLGARQPLVSLFKTFYYFLTGGFLYLVLVDQSGQDRKVMRLFYCFLAAAYLVALYGVLEFALGRNFLYGTFFSPQNEVYRRLAPDPWFGRRITSTFGHPVALGAYLVLVLPISLAAALSAQKRWQQISLGAGTLMVLVALLLTFARGAWMAGIAAIGVYGVLRRTKLLLLLIGLGLVVVGILSFSKVGEIAGERLKDAYNTYVLNFAITTRGAAYGYAAAIANRHPLLGLGTGMYRFEAYALRQKEGIPTPLGVLDTPDNLYLMWLAENGVLGLTVAVYVLLSLFCALGRAGKEPNKDGQLAWGFAAGLAGLGVDMLTVDALYFHVVRTIFWIAVGLAVALFLPKKEEGR